MIPLYFITSHEDDPAYTSWLNQDMRWLGMHSNVSKLLCFLEHEDAAQMLAYEAAHKHWPGRVVLRKMMGKVYPAAVWAGNPVKDLVLPVTQQVFVHADRGPYRYYVIVEQNLGLYVRLGKYHWTLENSCRDATAFRSSAEAFAALEKVAGDELSSLQSRVLMSNGVKEPSKIQLRVEKRHGFLGSKDVSGSRMRTLLSRKDRWTTGSILVQPDFETF